MAFKLTYATMFNPPEELHKGFDKAVATLKQNLGQEWSMIIDNQDVFADEKWDDHSPVNTDWVLAKMQKGNAGHAHQAIEAARRAFPKWSHTPWQERVKLVRKAAALLEKRIFDLGAAMAHGSRQEPHGESRRCAGNRRLDVLFREDDGGEQGLCQSDGQGSARGL